MIRIIIKKITAFLMITALLTSCVSSGIETMTAVTSSDTQPVTSAVSTSFHETSAVSGIIGEADAETYTTPYGTFRPIPRILEINRYMTENPVLLDRELSMVYITPDGDSEEAEEITERIKALSDEICAGLEDDRSKAYALAMWTGTNIAYDYDAAHDMSDLTVTSLKAVLDNGFRTTCGGFANFYAALCSCQGIYCLNMKGGTSSEGWTRAQLEEAPANHEWNAVLIEGEWYYSDCTWICDLGYENGETKDGERVLPFYALFGFGEMSIEHRIDRCEHREFLEKYS